MKELIDRIVALKTDASDLQEEEIGCASRSPK